MANEWRNPDQQHGFDWHTALSGLGGIGGGLAGLFGGNNQNSPSDAANQYLNQIPGQTGHYFDPYINAGKNQLPGLEHEYQGLLSNPGGKFNDIGKNFQQSPGFKFALEQALGGANRAAAAGGMVGSPANMQQDMGLATNMANQDYYNYMQGATGLYGQGLQGSQGLAGMGMNAGGQQANMIAQMLAQQAANAQEEQAGKNRSQGGAWGDILGGVGKAVSAFI